MTEPEKLDLVTEARELLAKATPGPWQVERNTKRLEVSPIRPDGQWVSMVAQVYKSGRCNGNNYRMPAEANAALIRVKELQDDADAKAGYL